MEKQHHDILARYSAILELHEHMLEIAMAGDWEQLIEMKSAHLCQVEALINFEHNIVVDDGFREAKRAVLMRIAYAEEQLRDQLQARMAQLSGAIAKARNTQRVKHAYEGGVAS